jgi:hypothetical protein
VKAIHRAVASYHSVNSENKVVLVHRDRLFISSTSMETTTSDHKFPLILSSKDGIG